MTHAMKEESPELELLSVTMMTAGFTTIGGADGTPWKKSLFKNPVFKKKKKKKILFSQEALVNMPNLNNSHRH